MPVDRLDRKRRLFSLAADQAGHFTAAEAKALGYSYAAQAHHVQAGNWLRVDRGIFRLREWIPGPHDDLVRWTLWSKRRAIVSHQTALGVHGVGEFESPRVHLTVPRDFRMGDTGLMLHRAELPQEDVVDHSGFRVTTVTRSIIDVASLTPDEEQLASSIENALEQGSTTRRQLRMRSEAVDPLAALRVERALSRL